MYVIGRKLLLIIMYGRESSSIDRTSSLPTNTGKEPNSLVNVVCTELCGNFRGKSCHHLPISVYAKLDEQSNKSLAKPEVFERFDPNTTCESYKLSTCSRSSIIKRSHRFVIRSLDGHTAFELPSTIIECKVIPFNRLTKLSLITPISPS